MLLNVNVGVEDLKLSEFSLEGIDLDLKGLLLQQSLLIGVLSVSQVVDDHLILIMLILELEHVIGSFVLSLLRLLYDRKRVDILTYFQLAVSDTQFLNLCIRFTKFLLNFCLIGWILFKLVQSCLHLLSLPVERLRVQISFLDLLVETARVALDSRVLMRRLFPNNTLLKAAAHWRLLRRMGQQALFVSICRFLSYNLVHLTGKDFEPISQQVILNRQLTDLVCLLDFLLSLGFVMQLLDLLDLPQPLVWLTGVGASFVMARRVQAEFLKTTTMTVANLSR